MPQPHTLKITEIFPSIQGEGLRQGEATLFIRLSGCNLKCSFCDTKYAWQEGKEMSTAQVLERIKKARLSYPARWVCLTGGEPLIQDVSELVEGLSSENLKIQVETNALVYRSLLVDWYTVSPKPEKYFHAPEYRKEAREVKIVVTKNLNADTILKIREEFPEKTPIFLQPQSNLKWSMSRAVKVLESALKAGAINIRLSIQLHKIYGLR